MTSSDAALALHQHEDDQDDDSFQLAIPSFSQLRGHVTEQVHNQVTLLIASFSAAGDICADIARSRWHALRGVEEHRFLDLKAAARKRANTFTRTPVFEQMAEKAFDEVDFDGDGSVNEAEVYCMVLLLYMKIQRSAQVHPPSKAQVIQLVKRFDVDKNGTLDRQEFTLLATVLCQNVALRVAAEMALKIILAPMFMSRIVALLSRLPIWQRVALPAFLKRRLGDPAQFVITAGTGILISVLLPALIASVDQASTGKRSVRAAQKALIVAQKTSVKLHEKLEKELGDGE